jgi:hypothetical protein
MKRSRDGSLRQADGPGCVEEREELRVQGQQEGDAAMEPTTLEGARQLFREHSLRTRREDIRRLVQLRFGRVWPEVDELIATTWTEDGMTGLFDRAVVAQHEDELLRPIDGVAPWWAQQLFRDNSLRTRREDIKRLVELKFGRVSPEVDALIAATKTEGGLRVLFDHAVVAQNEDDFLRPPE